MARSESEEGGRRGKKYAARSFSMGSYFFLGEEKAKEKEVERTEKEGEGEPTGSPLLSLKNSISHRDGKRSA